MIKYIFLCMLFSTLIKTQADKSKIPQNILSQLEAKAAEGGQEEADEGSPRRISLQPMSLFPGASNLASPSFWPDYPYSPCNCWFNIWGCFVPVMNQRLQTIQNIYNQLSGLSCYAKKQVLYCYVRQLLSRCRNRWFQMIAQSWFNSYIESLC